MDGSNPQNVGFVRNDALLLIVILSNEDDCSVADTAMFDNAQASIDDELGPWESFRCFEFGVACDDDQPRLPGVRTACGVREPSPYMTAIADYVTFIRALKTDPTQVMVAAITGDTGPVEVFLNSDSQGHPELRSTCPGSHPPPLIDAGPPPPLDDDGPQTAAPGIRLRAFLDGFPGRSVFQPLCAEDMASSLRAIARLAGTVSTASSTCLLGPIANADLCRVFHATNPQTDAEIRTPVPNCRATGGAVLCFTIESDPARCGHTDSGLSVLARASATTPADAHVVVECPVSSPEPSYGASTVPPTPVRNHVSPPM